MKQRLKAKQLKKKRNGNFKKNQMKILELRNTISESKKLPVGAHQEEKRLKC